MEITFVSFTQKDGTPVSVNPAYVTHFTQTDEDCTALYISNCDNALWIKANARTVEDELTGNAQKRREQVDTLEVMAALAAK